MTQPLLLLVDDAPEIPWIVQRLGKRIGLTVVCCPDVPTAWQYLQGCVQSRDLGADPLRRPDLVVVDVHLPGTSGLELCRRIRGASELADLPLALFGSWDREEDILAGLQEGIDFVLIKDLISQPEAWGARMREILALVNSQPVPLSLSCQKGPLPVRDARVWSEAIQRAQRHASVRRLGGEVLRSLVLRAGGGNPDSTPDQMEVFASRLEEEIRRVAGSSVSEPFRRALEAALAGEP